VDGSVPAPTTHRARSREFPRTTAVAAVVRPAVAQASKVRPVAPAIRTPASVRMPPVRMVSPARRSARPPRCVRDAGGKVINPRPAIRGAAATVVAPVSRRDADDPDERLRATGAEAAVVERRGGGGGLGGVVVLEAPTIEIVTEINANAGAGGEGGANVGGTPVAGQNGADGGYGTTAAQGGEGSDDRFGFGGDGGVDATAAGIGKTSDAAGGGGGGGVGIVRLFGTRSGAGLITPPPS
jgi:hypothetical protein